MSYNDNDRYQREEQQRRDEERRIQQRKDDDQRREDERQREEARRLQQLKDEEQRFYDQKKRDDEAAHYKKKELERLNAEDWQKKDEQKREEDRRFQQRELEKQRFHDDKKREDEDVAARHKRKEQERINAEYTPNNKNKILSQQEDQQIIQNERIWMNDLPDGKGQFKNENTRTATTDIRPSSVHSKVTASATYHYNSIAVAKYFKRKFAGTDETHGNWRSARSRMEKPRSGPYGTKDPAQSIITSQTSIASVGNKFQYSFLKEFNIDSNFKYFHTVLKNKWRNYDKYMAIDLGMQFEYSHQETDGLPGKTPLEISIEKKENSFVLLFLQNYFEVNLTQPPENSLLLKAISSGSIPILKSLLLYATTNESAITSNKYQSKYLSQAVIDLLKDGIDTATIFHFEQAYHQFALLKTFDTIQDDDISTALSGISEKYKTQKESITNALSCINIINSVIQPSRRTYTNQLCTFKGKIKNKVALSPIEFDSGELGFAISASDRICMDYLQRKKLTGDTIKEIEFRLRRNEFFIDHINMDPKVNPKRRALLHEAVERSDYLLVAALCSLGPNFHAKDTDGYTPLHLLALHCDNKDTFITHMRQMIGTSKRSNNVIQRESLFPHGEFADPEILNFDGNTFMDILAERMPDWVEEVSERLDVPKPSLTFKKWSCPVPNNYPEENLENDKRLKDLVIAHQNKECVNENDAENYQIHAWVIILTLIAILIYYFT